MIMMMIMIAGMTTDPLVILWRLAVPDRELTEL